MPSDPTPITLQPDELRDLADGRLSVIWRKVEPQNSKFRSADTRAFWPHADFAAPHPGTLIDGNAAGSGEYLHVPCHCQDDGGFPVSKNVDCAYCREYGLEGTRHRLYCVWSPGDVLYVREPIRYRVEHDNYYYVIDDKGVGTQNYIRMSRMGGQFFMAQDMPPELARYFIRIQSISVQQHGPSGEWCWRVEVERVEPQSQGIPE